MFYRLLTSNNFKIIHWLTGSQRRYIRHNVVTFPASRNKLNRTTEFCTFCKRSIKNLGRPYSNELQLSNSQGLVEVSVHLGFFGYELSDW